MGEGMNISMQGSYNLGWKLGSVLTGTADRRILSTYDSERRPVAVELIIPDKKMSEFYSDGPSSASEDYQTFRDQFSTFLSGVSITYDRSTIVTAPCWDRAMPNESH